MTKVCLPACPAKGVGPEGKEVPKLFFADS